MKALVVDDSKAIRSILRKTLKEIGVEVIAEATHGVEALSRLRERVGVRASEAVMIHHVPPSAFGTFPRMRGKEN